MIVTTMPTSTLLSSTSILPSPSSSSSSSSCSTSSYLSLGAYNQFTESMHTLSDIDDMVNGLVGNSSVGQHNNNNNNGQSGHQQSYCEDNGDYGLEGPTGPHASYLDNGSEFYPSVVGSTMVSDSKYTSDYITASKSSYTEVINSRGRYSDNLTSLDLMNSYGSHQYDNSFQTVPSPIPTTPSPEQWASELSPHSSSVSNRSSSSTNNLNNSSSNANTSVNNCVNSSNSCNYSKSTSNNTNNINNDSIFGSINSSANVQQQQQQPHPTSQLDHHQQHHLSHNHHSHLQQQHQHSPYNGLHSRDHSFTSSSGSFPSSLSPATNGNDQNGKSMFQISDLSGNITTLNSPVTGEYNCFPNLPSFDLLRSSCLDLDGQGSSPSSSGSESDRESTSSSMTTVNERQTAHLLAAVENTDPNLVATIPGHTIIDPITGIPGKSLPTLNAPLTVPVKKVGRRGRPPKKDAKSRNRQGKGNGKLWEFIRDLLLDSATNPSLIRWERREDGVFKFVQSDKVAKLWGQRKQNPRMTYEKLSRAMRYYYKSQVLLPVFGRRLVYKFGPNATGWRAHPLGLM